MVIPHLAGSGWALSSFQLTLAILNFPFNEITQSITLNDLFRNMCSAIDKAKTTGLIAIALERACHVPFSRRVEESKFFAICNVTQSSYFHLCCVKKTIRVTSMIDVLQKIWMQSNI